MVQAASAVIEHHKLGTLDSYTFTTHNSGNNVFVGSRYVVKLYTERKGDGTRKESRVCHVLRHRIPTPKIVTFGKTGENTPYLVSQRMQGTALQLVWDRLSEAERQQYSEAIGRTLALIHSSPIAELKDVVPQPGFAPQAGLRQQAKEFLDVAMSRKLLPQETCEALSQYCDRQIAQATAIENTILHGGFRPGNILVADGRVTGVIDWEDAHLGDPAEEVALVLRRTIPKEYHDAFLTGYQGPQSLPLSLSPLRLVYPLLYYLRFLPEIESWKEFPAKQASYRHETKKIIKEILER